MHQALILDLIGKNLTVLSFWIRSRIEFSIRTPLLRKYIPKISKNSFVLKKVNIHKIPSCTDKFYYWLLFKNTSKMRVITACFLSRHALVLPMKNVYLIKHPGFYVRIA